MSEPVYIDRPPRIQPELPFDEIEIPGPPDKEQRGWERLLQVALPALTIVGYLVISMTGRGRSLALMIPMGLSVVGSIAFSLYSHRQEKLRQAAQELAYYEKITEMTAEMNQQHDQQRRFYNYNYSNVDKMMQLAETARVEVEKERRSLRSETRLWERRTSDTDFGVVRLGMGTLPSSVIYTLGEVDNDDDPQMREALKLEDDSRFVSNIPVILSLRPTAPDEDSEEDGPEAEDTRTPATHALGIAGRKSSVYHYVRAMVSHFAVFHAPTDARIKVLATNKDEWGWTDHIPHSQGDETPSTCFVSMSAGKTVDTRFSDDEGDELEKFLEGIRKTLSTRKIRLQDRDESNSQGDPTLPLMLVIVDLLESTLDPDSPLYNIEADAAISILIEEGALLGAAVVFLVPERSKVPSGCQSVLEIEKTTPATNQKIEAYQRLHFRYTEIGVNAYRYTGEADEIASQNEIVKLSKSLETVQLRRGGGANLTSAVLFMDLMGFNSMRQLIEQTKQNWRECTDPNNVNWLRAKLGMMAGNKPRTLTFSAKRDGVHGMVAGSTGSGKSELLISLIASMAVTYDPTTLNFVLVDYKGGGAFKEFETLPHCVDIITNLAGEGVTRMFTAITAEMNRRQKLNVDTGTKDIVDYREQGFHLDGEPYPFLFIIIDEFAEMISDRPEYRSELESITRLGRAQGISLILAAQRPSGVTDQMRSNIKFRISLRVETPAESREMLRRTDAAFLPNGVPGRGYLQVGNDEIELIQVAYAGNIHKEPPSKPLPPVFWPDRPSAAAYSADENREPTEIYKYIIEKLNQTSVEEGIAIQSAPWPKPLPETLTLQQLLIASAPDFSQNLSATQNVSFERQSSANLPITSEDYLSTEAISTITLGQGSSSLLYLNPYINSWLAAEMEQRQGWLDQLDWGNYAIRPVVGLVDNPYAAAQLPLVLEMQRGHVALFGASGWGKTSFVRTLIISLAVSHSPKDFHAYVLDLGGRSLNRLAELPHVGAVISPDTAGYEERVEQLLRELDSIVQKRKELLSEKGIDDIYKYNALQQREEGESLPAIVVAIDNFTEFRETFENNDDNIDSALDQFVNLARQSRPFGVHFVITASQLGVVPSQVFSLFTERLALKLAAPSDYRAIVGGHVGDVGEIPGHGYIKIGRQPLSFQIALPFNLETDNEEHAAPTENTLIEQLAGAMHQQMKGIDFEEYLPVEIKALPTSMLYRQILSREYDLKIDDTFVEQLRTKMKENWANSLKQENADWLQSTIGVISGNRPRMMNLEAKRDGVHGLIAGGTGSGKSELLMTLIVDLAHRYDPSVLNFVLVDYKGGGAFKPFEDLPHCVDIVTNLNKSAVHRMFTAINAEMQRRQALNVQTGTKDIVDYREKGCHLTHEPYPHLFIIIDEYAEMISDSPEFRDELESITRVGRAQGVNLLLASQRPTGVTDQMRANIKFRICLRVEGVDTSREMLRRSDAAFLPNGMPGRGYLQVGNDNIELIQVAWTGDTYELAQPKEDGGEKPSFYEIMVDLTNEVLEGERPRTPWPPFLPTAMTFSDALVDEYLDEEYVPFITLAPNGHDAETASATSDGDRQLAINYHLEEWLGGTGEWHGMDWNKTAMRGIAGIVDDPHGARQVPLTLDFTRGNAIVFGTSGWGKTTLIRSLVVSTAASHAPNEFHTHIVDLGGGSLRALENLPHVGTVIVPDEQGFEERVQQILRELSDEVNKRRTLFNDAGVSGSLMDYNTSVDEQGNPRSVQPALLVIVDNFGEFIESFGDQAGNNDDNPLGAFVTLVRQGRSYGLYFLITVTRLNEISSKIYNLFTERLTFKLADASEYGGIVGKGAGELEEVAGRGLIRFEGRPLNFQVALIPGTVDKETGLVRNEANQVRQIGKNMMAHIESVDLKYDEPLNIGALPSASLFRQVLQEQHDLRHDKHFLDDLERHMHEQWEKSREAEKADWLAVTLGITSGNRKRTLELEAKKDGVHGMIAGGTGSGKSELLMTLIVGLAINYSPDILNFVLVDYKGGGAFKPFESLPHCVDIVTNLNTAAVDRMFTAINAEIRRRQALNTATGTKDIVDYRERGYHLTNEPYPHLFVIIDEYAEMIDDNPDYRAELESITRVGRAQGVNLLLASQRPKGVSDQMRANIKFRICLRVEEKDTSREMLQRPDAALLPNGMPGRGYIQIGNENIELIQVSWTGDDQPDERDPDVEWLDRQAWASDVAEEEPPKFFDAVVSMAYDLAGQQMARKPWPSFLPVSFSLQSTLRDAMQNKDFTLLNQVNDWLNGDTSTLWQGIDWHTNALRPVVGLLDDPAEATQEPFVLDLASNHLVIMGDSGWGKTTMLRTIMTSLAATHTPNELHMYALDLGGRNFRMMEGLPHLGAVIYAADETFEERLNRLVDKLQRMVELRQQFLADKDASTLLEYNARHPESPYPAIVVFIDNFAELNENYESLVEGTIMPLVRRSQSVGISFVATCNAPNNMISKLYGLFGERVTFKQSNKDRYMDIVGRGANEIDDIGGRGYIRKGRTPLLFHIAQPVGLFDAAGDGRDDLSEGDELRLMAKQMQMRVDSLAKHDNVQWNLPDEIKTLDEIVLLQAMLGQAKPSGSRRNAIVGQRADFEPAQIDLKRFGPHFIVTGPPLSGKTTALYNMVLSLASRYTPDEAAFILVDMQDRFAKYGGERNFTELPHVLTYLTEVEQVAPLMELLQNECMAMNQGSTDRELFIIVDNFDDFSEELERERDQMRELATLARRYGTDGLHFVIGGALDSGISDLRRRVQSSNYGIGLRTASAVEALRVMRTPPGLRNKELVIGRGYLVRSGQPTMVQVATPYESGTANGSAAERIYLSDEEQEEQKSIGLDNWIAEIQARYPEQKAEWSDGVEGAELDTSNQLSPRAQRMVRLIEEGAIALEHHAMEHGGKGSGGKTIAAYEALDEDSRRDEQELMTLVKNFWLIQMGYDGLEEEIVASLVGGMGEDDYLEGAERMLAEAEDIIASDDPAVSAPLENESNSSVSSVDRQDPTQEIAEPPNKNGSPSVDNVSNGRATTESEVSELDVEEAKQSTGKDMAGGSEQVVSDAAVSNGKAEETELELARTPAKPPSPTESQNGASAEDSKAVDEQEGSVDSDIRPVHTDHSVNTAE